MHAHDHGLAHHLRRLREDANVDRRSLLRWMTTVPLVGYTARSLAAELCDAIPEEIAGPFPADGTNGPNALNLADIVRRDIRSSIGRLTGRAVGVELSLQMRVLDASDCSAIGGYAVYVWHANCDGLYSMYDVADQNYLRGVQVSGAGGLVTFRSIFPGCYGGRWPHVHFEVYESLAEATRGTRAIATSQIAFPGDACADVYAATSYADSQTNFRGVSLRTDNVFDDGWSAQMATVTGSVSRGLTAALDVAI